MRTSDSIKEIATALAKAQGEIANPVFNKTNPHFKSQYADLSSVLNAVRPVLSKHGISIMQMTNLEEAGLVLYTRLTHTSGEWIESVYPVSISTKHQEIAASLTYAKRLSLSAIAGVAGEDDDDGNAANTVPVSTKATAKKTETTSMTAEESGKVREAMLASLNDCQNKNDLQAWATANAKSKNMLVKADQDIVTKSFQEAQIRVKDKGDAAQTGVTGVPPGGNGAAPDGQ